MVIYVLPQEYIDVDCLLDATITRWRASIKIITFKIAVLLAGFDRASPLESVSIFNNTFGVLPDI